MSGRHTASERLADSVIRQIRAVFDARRKARRPTNAELAEKFNISSRMVRAVGARAVYKSVPDRPSAKRDIAKIDAIVRGVD